MQYFKITDTCYLVVLESVICECFSWVVLSQISHEVAVQDVSHLKVLLGLENPFPIWLPHMAQETSVPRPGGLSTGLLSVLMTW